MSLSVYTYVAIFWQYHAPLFYKYERAHVKNPTNITHIFVFPKIYASFYSFFRSFALQCRE